MSKHNDINSELDVQAEAFHPFFRRDVNIPPTLMELMARFAEDEIVETTTPLDKVEHEKMLRLMLETPGSTTVLRQLCDDVVRFRDMEPLPEAIQNQWMGRIFPQEKGATPANFTLRLSRGSLKYLSLPDSVRESRSFQMARGDEKATILTHSQRLSNCAIEVTIEAAPGQKFRIALKFTFVNPQYPKESLAVLLVDQNGQSLSENIAEDIAEFEDLPAGQYSARITSNGAVIDQFSADLSVDETE